MDNAVSLAALSLTASVIACIVWVVKITLGKIAPALDNHTKAADRIVQATEDNTKVSQEMITFMKKLNGKLPALVDEKKKQAAKE